MNCPNCNAQVAPALTFCPECGTRMPSAPPATRVLQGRYELTKQLGQGGMGAVYLASDRRLSTVRWAVKEMSDAAITSPLDRQQASDAFRQEAELLASLSHPNLPRVTDHFQEDGKNYLVMELVPGETLLAYGQRLGLPRPLAEVLGWADQLCEVLGYLHGQRPPVIFRDLKPANVMLTPAGQLKLIDFGIARLFKPGQSRDTQAFGTMGYSAPEQYGRGQTDARSDVYSMGVLLHQLLTGYDPAATPFRLPLASEVNPAVPAAVAAAIAQATSNDPEQRFAGVDELRQALRGAGGVVQRAATTPPTAAPAIGQTVALSGAATAGSPPAPQSTTLARVAFWMGAASAGVMALATLMMAAAASNGGSDNPLSGFAILLALLPLAGGPAAAVLGVVALTRAATASTMIGRRQAAIGVATGVATVLLCCVLTAMLGSTPSDPESLAPRPAAAIWLHTLPQGI